jgi:uncharacterized protein (TIGR02147 family)
MNVCADYRQTIKTVYAQRREKNPSYSLRSFARDLSVSTSMLSEVLNYKKNLTRKTAVKINESLKLSKNEAKLFLLSVDLDSPGIDQSREVIQKEIDDFSKYGDPVSLNDDDFSYISDYRHLVFLALMGIQGFRSNLSWIAGKLGIFQHQVNTLVSRLRKLKIISLNDKNEFQYENNFVFSTDGKSSLAIRTFHKSTLQHTIQMIDMAPVHERDLCTSIFAIDQNDFTEMQSEIRDFQKKMYLKYSGKKTADRVYSIQNQLIPYTSRSVE